MSMVELTTMQPKGRLESMRADGDVVVSEREDATLLISCRTPGCELR
jgi:hypothetical protein